MALQDEGREEPPARPNQSFIGASRFETIRERANSIGLSDRALWLKAKIPATTFRRYCVGKFGQAVKFDQHLGTLASVVDAEEERLRAVLLRKQPTRKNNG